MQVQDPRLDRKVFFDPRSLNYRIRDLAPAQGTPRSRAWRTPIVLDQGREGACVGFAWAGRAGTSPHAPKPLPTNQDAIDLYHLAQKDDETPGENYVGSSTLGGAKAAQQQGRIASYYWATTIEEIIQALSRVGPLVIGINWYDSMYEPLPNQQRHTVAVSGTLAGGHDILVNAVNLGREQARLHNSWGPSWGDNGEAWISLADLERLVIKEQGDACVSLRAVKP